MSEILKTESVQSANDKNSKRSGMQSSALSEHTRVPEFFLYTKLGQNETKSLRKAPTNKAER
jgi:hypothetical protein